MKISIVTPVYNEEKTLKTYLSAIVKLDYPKEYFEVVFSDDGSTDDSMRLIEEFKKTSGIDCNILRSQKNRGRSITMERGVRAAKYEHIMFLGCKCEICPGALREIADYKYPLINLKVVQKNNNIFDRLFYLIRYKIYANFPGKVSGEVYITKDNFDYMGKGTVFCTKEMFFSSQIDNKNDRNSSDDVKLMWNMVQKMPILCPKRTNALYHTRTSFIENVKHIFERGPKFVDYYYKPSKRYFGMINASLILALVIVAILIFKRDMIKDAGIIIICLDFILSVYLAKKITDFFIVFILFPIFGVTFFAGVIKGLFLKLLCKIKKI